ncbi:MAG: hypothetical protein IJY74_00640 [Oscillospiraceae bacterium]|nr:hypothetical protein [Oscillospiraceae bacterium]
MADKKFTLEEILSEYGEKVPEKKAPDKKTSSGKLEMHRMLSNTAAGTTPQYGPERPAAFRRAEEESKISRIKRDVRSSGASKADIENSRTAAFQTLELMREKVSFVNSAAANPQTAPAPKNDRIDGYEGAVRMIEKEQEQGAPVKESYLPKIRAMEDSTRAKEERETKGKRRKTAENRHQYKKDTVKKEKPAPAEPAVQTEDDEKPFFFDLHHANAAKLISREAREERERRRRVSAIRRLRKKRMKMRELDEAYDGTGAAVHIPNNDSEIRANINILQKTVFIRIAVLAVLFIISTVLCITENNDGGMTSMIVSAIGNRGYSIIHLLLGAAAIGVSFPTVANGIKYLCINRADSDSMAAVPVVITTLGAAVTAILPESMERGEAHMFVPVAIFILLMNAVGKQLIIRRAMNSFSVISGKYDQYVLTYVDKESDAEALTRGVQPDYPILVSMRRARHMSDFLRYTYSSDLGDRFCRKITPVMCIAAILIAACITGIRFTVMPGEAVAGFFFSVFSMILCGGCCSGIMLAANIPLYKASKNHKKRNCALLGYQSVDEFYDANSLMVSASTLFTESSVSIDGMKPFGDVKIEEVILVAASLAHQADSVLKHAFDKVIDGENSSLYPVDSVLYEEGHGLSGWVKNRRVLLGNREMMLEHNIEGLPAPAREAEFAGDGNDVLYFSTSGVLSAVILVKVSANEKMKQCLRELVEENVVLTVKSVDCFLTQQRIAGLYQISESCMKVVPLALNETFDRYAEPTDNVSASVIASGRIDDTIRLLLSARKIRRSSAAGVIIQATAAIIGFAIALIYIGLSAYTSVTAEMFLIFQLAASAVTAIAVGLKQ